MAIQVSGITVIDNSRNITNIGVATITSALNVGTGGTIITTTAAGLVGIGTTVPTQTLHVQGNARITGAIYDSTNSTGTSGQVLQSTATGTEWTTAAGGGTNLGLVVASTYNMFMP